MRTIWLSLLIEPLFAACADKPLDMSKPVYVTVSTAMGDVTVELYGDTPLHRDNFIRLCRSGAYDGVLFHRVIKGFVVQGGDPDSRKREPGVLYGGNDGGYTVPAEIRSGHFNKRGALIDAKAGDETNPERASAGTQFCFVQGRRMTDEELDEAEKQINEIRRNWLFHLFKKRLSGRSTTVAAEEGELERRAWRMVEDTLSLLGRYRIPEERRAAYRTIGGAPHLDGSLTVFGEVVDGFDVIDRMARVETDPSDRPVHDLVIRSTKVFQK